MCRRGAGDEDARTVVLAVYQELAQQGSILPLEKSNRIPPLVNLLLHTHGGHADARSIRVRTDRT